jgi:sigma-B regulation protein RsbU (phosphoserine phosphatase)
MAVLQILRGMTPGKIYPLTAERIVLGRHPECDIVVDAGAISRQHAVITRSQNDFYVEDLKSRNGTYVNGEQIHGRRLLQENDRVKICDLLFAFHVGSGPGLNPAATLTSDDTSRAEIIDDTDGKSSATIMSTFDMQAGRSGLNISVNPEMKLQAMLEITRNLASATDLPRVLTKVLDSLFKIFIQADRGFVILKDPASEALIPKAVRYRRGDDSDSIRVSRTIINQVMQKKEAILSNDAAGDSRFDGSQSIADFRIRSMICAPLIDSENQALGIIQIDTLDQRSRFQPGDLDVLSGVASQAAFAVENAQLHETALKKQAFERDLELAHKVQQGFLPESPPKIEGYEFFDFYEAANQIGGDYFDYVPLADNKLAIVLGDVAGKGMPAALLMAKLSADVRFCFAGASCAATAINRLNDGFSRSDWEDRFVTLAAIVLDPVKNEISVVNAGHMAPYLLRVGGGIDTIGEDEKGLPLGVAPHFEFEAKTMTLAPGEVVVLYTDGFNEAMNTDNKLYGFERMTAQLARTAKPGGVGPKAIGKDLLDDVRKFVGTRAQSDDRCLICFGRVK